jgi:hypothetical protein
MGSVTNRRAAAGWGATLWWAAVGALLAFGVAGLATIGLFLLAGAALLAALALLLPPVRRPRLPGLLVGVSTAPLFIAWLNRGGPGEVCTTTAESVSCADQWSPWPFLAVGVAVLASGVALLVRLERAPGPVSRAPAATAGPAPRT